MIIPVRCFTCGNPIGNKYAKYLQLVNKYIREGYKTNYLFSKKTDVEITAESKALNDIKCKRYCCRTMILSHVETVQHL